MKKNHGIRIKVFNTGKSVKKLSKEYACCKKTQRRTVVLN